MFPSRPSDPFWLNEDALLMEATDDLVLTALLAGGASGLTSLPVGAQQLVDMDIFNQQALDYLFKYQLATVPGLNATTRKSVIKIIEDWLLSGESLQALEGKLVPIFGSIRAARIAATEITRIYAMGNQIIWMASGLVGAKRWMTANDERVCPLCGSLDGTIVQLEGNFALDANGVGNSPQMKAILGKRFTPELGTRKANTLLKGGSSWLTPPAHTNCRCWLQPLVSEELFQQAIDQILGLG